MRKPPHSPEVGGVADQRAGDSAFGEDERSGARAIGSVDERDLRENRRIVRRIPSMNAGICRD